MIVFRIDGEDKAKREQLAEMIRAGWYISKVSAPPSGSYILYYLEKEQMYLQQLRRNGQTLEQLHRSDEDAKILEWRPIPDAVVESVHAIVEPRTVR